MNPDSSKAFALPSPVDPVVPSTPRTTPTSIPTLSRKRSRDESNLEEDNYFTAPFPSQTEENGLVGIPSPLRGTPHSFQAENGAWKDDQIPMTPPAERPMLRSNKSQRLDLTATPVISEEINLGNGILIAPSPPKSNEPTIDDVAIHLGIGWSRISAQEHMQAAARGWAKFIENRYALTDVEIKLESRGLASYLVAASEGWFLFSEDLLTGRLVAKDLNRCFENLRTTPPIFDGDGNLETAIAHSPQRNVMATDVVELNGMASHSVMVNEPIPNSAAWRSMVSATHAPDVDMDMS